MIYLLICLFIAIIAIFLGAVFFIRIKNPKFFLLYGLIIFIAYLFFLYPQVRKINVINEIVYIFPRVLVYTKGATIMENLPEEVTFKQVMNKNRSYYSNKGEFLNADFMPIKLMNGKIVSLYNKKDIEEAEKMFIEINKDFEITKECKDDLCSITIEKK